MCGAGRRSVTLHEDRPHELLQMPTTVPFDEELRSLGSQLGSNVDLVPCPSSNLVITRKDEGKSKKARKQRLAGRDVAAIQKKLQKRTDMLERVRTKNPEKADRISGNMAIEKALKRAQGEKVKVRGRAVRVDGAGTVGACCRTTSVASQRQSSARRSSRRSARRRGARASRRLPMI